MKLPAWFSKRSKSATPATVDDLTERLEAARADAKEVDAAVEAARQRLNAERSEDALTALRNARQAAADVHELLGIIEADVAKAEEQKAADARAELERKRDEIAATLADNSRANELVDLEFEAWRVLINARLARDAHARELSSLRLQMRNLDVTLGREVPTIHLHDYEHTAPIAPIVKKLEAITAGVPGNDPVALMVRDCVQILRGPVMHYQPTATAAE